MNANEIIKGLWIGNATAATDPNFFKKHNIKANVNCTKDVDFVGIRGVDYYRVPVNDTLKKQDFAEMIKYLPGAIQFIHQKHDIEGKNVLINCMAGMQRSAAITTAYLSAYRGMTIQQAVELILKRRPVAFHHGKHINFIESLTHFVNESKKYPRRTPRKSIGYA